MSDKTIAAIATALSNSGISIIRISGPDSISIIEKLFVSPSGKKLYVTVYIAVDDFPLKL